MAVSSEGKSSGLGLTDSRATRGFGCFLLFLLPFAAAGLVTAGLAVQRVGRGNWREMLFFTLFAVTFGGIGFGGMALVQAGKRKQQEQEALKARYPNEPWRWQKDWAQGRIDDASRLGVWAVWIFATLWNLVSIPAGVAGVRTALERGSPAGYVALLFPLVGAGLLVWAIRNTVRFRKYGISRLELSTTPASIGHTLAGVVRTRTLVQPADGFQVTLTCIRQVTTGSGKDRSISESILWQEEQRVRGEPSRDAVGLGTRIPVAFGLPLDVRPCDDSDPSDRVLWRLSVSAGVPGVDYQAMFEVPVFRTAQSQSPRSEEEERLTRPQWTLADYKQPEDSRITVSRNRRGTEIVFPAARNIGVAVGSTLFTGLWLIIVWVLIRFRAPLLFPIVFGLFGLLLIYGMLEMWLRVSRVLVDSGSIEVASGYLSPGRVRRLAAGEVTDVTTAIGTQAGATPYYDVVIVRKDGKKIVAGRSIRHKREAEWLAMTIKSALDLERRPAAA